MARARRVLPTPPDPVSVRRGTASSRRYVRVLVRSASRPMRRVRGMGGEPSRSAEADAAIEDAPRRMTQDRPWRPSTPARETTGDLETDYQVTLNAATPELIVRIDNFGLSRWARSRDRSAVSEA